MPKVTANGHVFNFPEGVSNDDIATAVDDYFSNNTTPVAQEAIASSGNFGTGGSANDIPGAMPQQNPQEEPKSSFLDKAVGIGEAGVATVLGGPLTMAGQIFGSAKGIGQSMVDGTYGTQAGADAAAQEAEKYASMGAGVFAPSTAKGKGYLQTVSEIAEPLAGLAPFTQEAAIIGHSAKAALPQARIAVGTLTDRSIVKKIDESKSMGAAEAGDAARRREIAAQLPVDPQLTEGQATRNFNQQRFENEAMKSEHGEPLRQRAAQQHEAIRQSFDDFIDSTGAQAPDIRATGIAIDKALTSRSRRDKNEIRAAYNKANNSEEARTPIDPNTPVTIGEGDNAINGSVIDYINSKPAGLRATGLIDDAKNYAVKLGIATKAEDGSLVGRPATLRAMEDWRREIGNATGSEPTDIRESTILKKIIDSQTEESVGPIFKRARALRAKYADQYENRAVISDLITNKRGTADRKVALEDVFDRIVFRGSLDDAKYVRKVLQNEGQEGQQAWRELQGAGLRYIRDEATKNVARDTRGNEMISPAGLHKAINRLDADGKLDAIYGKNGAQRLRDINDISKDLFTSPPGTINTSNTASVLLAALDMAVSGTAGLPLPIASGIRLAVKNVKDRKIKSKIQQALGNNKGEVK